jgi:hypothetical protein
MSLNKLTLSQKAARFSPAVCRLLARKTVNHNHVVALTDEEIRDASGLSLADVKALSYTASWSNVPLQKLILFTKACGVDFDDRKALQRHSKMMDGRRFAYLRRSPMWGTHFQPIFKEWALRIAQQKNHGKQSDSAD